MYLVTYYYGEVSEVPALHARVVAAEDEGQAIRIVTAAAARLDEDEPNALITIYRVERVEGKS